MVRMSGHFDGKVIVLDEPVNLPLNQRLTIDVEIAGAAPRPNGAAIIEAFERARKAFTTEDLDAMEEAIKSCERIDDDDQDNRF